MSVILGRRVIGRSLLPLLFAGVIMCSGCSFVQPAQDPTLPPQQASSGPVLSEAQQKAQVITSIENNPQIPANFKANAIAQVKGGSQNGSASGAVPQAGQPSSADLQRMIDSVTADPKIPAAQKQQIIAQIKQHM
jgi:hypothetical protein